MVVFRNLLIAQAPEEESQWVLDIAHKTMEALDRTEPTSAVAVCRSTQSVIQLSTMPQLVEVSLCWVCGRCQLWQHHSHRLG